MLSIHFLPVSVCLSPLVYPFRSFLPPPPFYSSTPSSPLSLPFLLLSYSSSSFSWSLPSPFLFSIPFFTFPFLPHPLLFPLSTWSFLLQAWRGAWEAWEGLKLRRRTDEREKWKGGKSGLWILKYRTHNLLFWGKV